MAININADTTNGLVITSDNSGEINFQNAGNTVASIGANGIDASGLTGTLPALDGSALTGISSFTHGTSVTITGVTDYTITGIPAGVKRLSVLLYNISTNGTAALRIRLGKSTGILTSGYLSVGGGNSSSTLTNVADTTCFILMDQTVNANDTQRGVYTLTKSNDNKWFMEGSGVRQGVYRNYACGAVDLGGTLDRIQLTNAGNTFDGGTMTLMWET